MEEKMTPDQRADELVELAVRGGIPLRAIMAACRRRAEPTARELSQMVQAGLDSGELVATKIPRGVSGLPQPTSWRDQAKMKKAKKAESPEPKGPPPVTMASLLGGLSIG